MPDPYPYAIEDAEADIAALRGQADRLSEILALSDSTDAPGTPASGYYLFSLSGRPNIVRASGGQDILSGSSSVAVSSVTVAGAVGSIASVTVAAAEMIAGSAYELTAFGNGTFGNPAGFMTWIPSLNGTGIGVANGPAAAAFAVGQALRWTATARFTVRTAGAGGTLVAALDGVVTQAVNNITPGTAANNSVPFACGPSATTAVNTTVSNTLDMRADTSNGTGGTLTAIGAYLKRVA